jgi:hypothetical protein
VLVAGWPLLRAAPIVKVVLEQAILTDLHSITINAIGSSSGQYR